MEKDSTRWRVTAERIRKLQGHANLLLSSFLGLRLNYGLLRPILGDLGAGVPQPPPRVLHHGLSAIRTTLFRSLVLDLVKLAWDKDERTPSVANLMRALKDRDVVRRIVELHSPSHVEPDEDEEERITRHRARVEEIDAERRREQVMQQLVALNESWSRLDSMPSKSDFIAMRHRHIAHLQVSLKGDAYQPLDFSSLGVRRGDLGFAVARMEEITWLLNAILCDSDFMMSRATEMFDESGVGFWKTLQE